MQLARPLKTELFEPYWYGAIDKIKQLCANIDVVVILSEKSFIERVALTRNLPSFKSRILVYVPF